MTAQPTDGIDLQRGAPGDPLPQKRRRETLAALFRGFSYVLKGGRFLFGHPYLLKYALPPWAIAAALFAVGFYLVSGATYPVVASALAGLADAVGGDAWWTYVVVPLVWLAKVLAWVVWFAAVVLSVTLAVVLVVGNIVIGPFHAALAAETERIHRGAVAGGQVRGFFYEMRRTIVEELKKSLFFLSLAALFALAGLIPGVGLLAIPLGQLFAVFFLGLAFTDFAMERRGMLFRHKRQFFYANPLSMLGFGLAILLVMAVPLLNILAAPMLVVGGTLLFLDIENRALGG
ncbi:MAG: EI24 domain-containing protein [Candidatus Schekmanbacteria bacterium]|nr:EI24 domain-containing protein [Candidatus Schekmanbacteria bacterium]